MVLCEKSRQMLVWFICETTLTLMYAQQYLREINFVKRITYFVTPGPQAKDNCVA